MRKNPLTTLLLAFSFLLGPLHADETTESNAQLLRDALFAEEAERDLAKAEQGYRELVKNFDTDRVYAATAILRLAEILHQRGDTAEAEKWFARVLREFPDQEALVKVATARLGDKAAGLAKVGPVPIDPQADEIERLTKLLEQSPDLLNTPIVGTTPLATAAAKGQLEVIEFLLSNGALVDGGSPSALAGAVTNGHLAAVKRLLKAASKPEANLVNKAVRSGNYAITELLLKAGADPNTADWVDLAQQKVDTIAEVRNVIGFNTDRCPEDVSKDNFTVMWTPLEISTFFRFTKLTELLLANGAKSQKENGRYTEDLRFAILDQNSGLVSKLLKNGADPNSQWQRSLDASHAISIAARRGNAPIVEQLIKAGAHANPTEPAYGRTPLFYANGETVDVLIAAGANPNARNNRGNTPLHETYDPAKVKSLLTAGADINARNENGDTPIVDADLRVLDVLLEAKPDLSLSGNQGTPLGRAVTMRYENADSGRIAKLIAAGADPNQIDKNGKTPLMMAVVENKDENVTALIKGGANPNGVPHSPAPLSLLQPKNTAQTSKIIRSLVDAGADPNVITANGQTPLAISAGGNDLETVRYLLEKGAALEVAGKFAYEAAPDDSPTKKELFLKTYQQPERRRGTIRVVSQERGIIHEEVAALAPTGNELPICPYSLLEAYIFSDPVFYFTPGEVTIWREGQEEVMKFDLRKIITSGDPKQDVKLAWGDLVQFSLGKSPKDSAVNETEKKFLDEHLNREVQFNYMGKTRTIRMSPKWRQGKDPGLWLRDRWNNIYALTDDVETIALRPTQALGLGDESGSRYIVSGLERNGLKIQLEPDKLATFWFEPSDQVSLSIAAEKKRSRYLPRPK